MFDAGLPGYPEFHEKVYKRLRDLDERGKLPVYIDGCYVVISNKEAEKGLKELKRFRDEFNTEHMKVHTLKIFMDGTPSEVFSRVEKLRTVGLDVPQVTELMHELKALGIDVGSDGLDEKKCAEKLAEMIKKGIGK